MNFQPADYVLSGVVAVMAVLGLFRGFSGTVAFLVGTVAASATAFIGWTQCGHWFSQPYYHALAVFVATLLAFGVARVIIKRLINGILAQPSDAIFGGLVGVVAGAMLILCWALSGYHTEYSSIVTEVARYVQ